MKKIIENNRLKSVDLATLGYRELMKYFEVRRETEIKRGRKVSVLGGLVGRCSIYPVILLL